MYEDKSLVNKIYLRRQLYNLKIKDKVSIHDHLYEFNAELMGQSHHELESCHKIKHGLCDNITPIIGVEEEVFRGFYSSFRISGICVRRREK